MTKNYFNLEGIKQREELKRKLENKKTVPHKTIDGEERISDIEVRITLPQSDLDSKVFVLEKLKHPDGSVELRFGYWIIGKKGRVKDKWAWGQFAPFIPPQDFEKIVNLAEEKNLI